MSMHGENMEVVHGEGGYALVCDLCDCRTSLPEPTVGLIVSAAVDHVAEAER